MLERQLAALEAALARLTEPDGPPDPLRARTVIYDPANPPPEMRAAKVGGQVYQGREGPDGVAMFFIPTNGRERLTREEP